MVGRYVLISCAWALVSTQAMTVKNQDPEGPETIKVPAHTVINLITYDGKSKYKAPKGTELFEVPEDTKFGDTVTE